MNSPRNFLTRELNKLSLINKKHRNYLKIKSENQYSSTAATSTCSHLVPDVTNADETSSKTLNEIWNKAKPYNDVPGPKPIPILGNTWR